MGTFRGRAARTARAVLAAAATAALLASPAKAATETPNEPVGGPRLGETGLVVDAPDAAPLPEVGAAAWLLADLDSGEVLAARDPHGRFRPASTLKILTALTVLPQLDPTATYVARFEDAAAEGSKVGVVPDATYTVHNLFEALFLVSGNDAAHALAHAAGGIPQTVAAMNEVARDLGARDTRAVNPSGLDAPGQLTSAYDLAVIARAGMAREDFRGYAATVKSQFPGKMVKAGKVRRTYEIYTQDRLLLNYRGALGIKTGWTTKARGTFVGAATRGGRTLVATVLHTEGDAWKESAALLTWGFRNAGLASPVGTLDAVPALETQAGRTGGPAAGRVPAAPAAAGSGGGGMPWWVEWPLVLLAVVALLRARVLLRRGLRRRRVAGLPQPRERRRATRAVTPAPRPAPRTAARPRPDDRRPEPAPTGTTSSASTGTAS